MSWSTKEAVDLCRLVESVAPAHGFHVALTGGLLYKDGYRKDADIVLYRIRQRPEDEFEANLRALLDELVWHGVLCTPGRLAFVVKASWHGMPIDILIPEFPRSKGGDYQ
jgi:hypothetical protein